ncbi:3-deoxy-D-manno-octulosonic-acid transferase [Candidatus Rhodobacter oscarellae]|uniref:3-deoxy-D-manno-octulosonic acid transferase n=1 Tax=Candidatus Rhodobacter oscarellae TaxID=1675527 RepID=A0A0J9E913_9RHOB|nr:3-deoxy-D-manno-octulosonic-acid transferase [Candidatus Rhodobacter lobularis]
MWLHSGADAEALAARELAKRMLAEREDLHFLLTTSATERLPSDDRILCQYAPEETQPSVRRFLDHWRPDLALWTEPELRPALQMEANARGVPAILVDAGTAPWDPLSVWSRGIAGDVLRIFRCILAADDTSAAQLRALGVRERQIRTTGYLREGAPALPVNQTEHDALAQVIGGRPAWLAAWIPEEERDAVLSAQTVAELRAHRLLLILVPSQPGAADRWAQELTAAGYKVARRSKDEEPTADVKILIADGSDDDEMSLWYRLAPVTYLGGSLSGKEVLNPFDAAALGSAIIHGPRTRRHRGAYERLNGAGATRRIDDAKGLGDAVEALLSPARAAELARQAWEVTTEGAEVTDLVLDLALSELEGQR